MVGVKLGTPDADVLRADSTPSFLALIIFLSRDMKRRSQTSPKP